MKNYLLFITVLLCLINPQPVFEPKYSTVCRNTLILSDQGFTVIISGYNIVLNRSFEKTIYVEYSLIKGSRVIKRENFSVLNGSIFSFETNLVKIRGSRYYASINYRSAEPYVESNVSYNVLFRQNGLYIENYTLIMETNNQPLLFKVNVTLTELALRHGGEYEAFSGEYNGVLNLTFKIRELEFNEENLTLGDSGYIVGLLFTEAINVDLLSSGSLDRVIYRYASTGSSIELYFELWSINVDHEVYGEAFVFTYSIDDSIIKLPYSYVKLVNVDQVNVSLIKPFGGLINVNINVTGRGKAFSSLDQIKSSILNAVELSRDFGCFNLLSVGFKIMDQKGRSIDKLDSSIDVTNLKVIYSGENVLTKKPMTLFVAVISIVLIATTLLVLKKNLGFRLLRLKRTWK